MEFREDGSNIGFEIRHVGSDLSEVSRAIEEKFGHAPEKMMVWTRIDENSNTYRSSNRGGPDWNSVKFRVTSDAISGNILDIEERSGISAQGKHRRLEGGPLDLMTTLIYDEDEQR